VRAARRAFADDSPWRRMNASDRSRIIWKVSELIEEHADELALLESLDNGKPFSVARAADIPLSADLFRYMAGWPTKIHGSTVPISSIAAPGDYHAYTLRDPVGVVGQIIPAGEPAFRLNRARWAGVRRSAGYRGGTSHSPARPERVRRNAGSVRGFRRTDHRVAGQCCKTRARVPAALPSRQLTFA
jgi:Aldehyde dehydrogenase family